MRRPHEKGVLVSFKDLLKRILPPPVHAFNREVARILDAVDQGRRETDALRELIAAQGNSLDQLRRQLDAERARRLQWESQARDEWRAQQQAALDKALEGQAKTLAALSQSLEQSAAGLQKQTDALAEAFAAGREQMEEGQSSVRGQLEQLKKDQAAQFKQIERVIPNKPIYWCNEFERRIVRENWGDVTERPDFPEKFVRLTSGMDADSVEAIIRILMRQKQFLTKDQEQFDFFTRKEQEELRLLRENFNSEIMKVSDHLFAYKNYLLPINHFESSVFYYRHGLSQLKTLDTVKGKAIVDVGGFIGDSVLVLSELSPSVIYTFESVPENFELLKQTVELNHVPNVVPENVALGAEKGTLTMHVSGSGSTSIDRPGMNYREDITVPVRTLDDYVTEHPMEIGLIKVDIEGGEPNFLAGAKETICTQKPILLLSIYHNAHDFFELKPLLESWNVGYRFSIHKPTFGNATSETLLLAEII